MHGKFVLHPFLDRRIPIITDGELVDMSFGALRCVRMQPCTSSHQRCANRLWRRQDHAGARPERFCLRQAPLAAEHQHLHRGWQHQRSRRQNLLRHAALRGPRGRGQGARRQGTAFLQLISLCVPNPARSAHVFQGLLRGKADNAMRLGLCSRSKDVIEPMLKPQVRTCSIYAHRVCVRY